MNKEVTDLMDLIELAEKVSLELDRLKNRKILILFFSAVFIILFACLAFIASIYYNEFFSNNSTFKPFILSIFIMFNVLIFIYFSLSMKKINKQISTESKVLDKLFNLITPYKSGINSNISILKQATIEMRLSRINFNGKENYSFPNFLFNFLRA